MMENNQQNLAERIADFLQHGETKSSDFAALQKSIERINERLFNIENNLFGNDLPIIVKKSFHPSQEKFELAESVAPPSIENAEAEKPCSFEPTGKPCDYCSMCLSRGF